MTNHTANVVAAFNAATADDLAQGLAWYGLAASWSEGMAAASGRLSTEQCAGVIAAMSPMMSWRSNLDVAARLIKRWHDGGDEPTSGYGMLRNVHKAWRILDGAPPLDVLSGPKVRAFYANIIGDPTAVTVDRWAARIARADPTDTGLVTKREYAAIAEAFGEAAVILNVTPRELQAATWVYYRRIHGRGTDDPQA